LVLLGTAGGPRPRKGRSGSAQAIVSGGNVYVIDCGYGVARQMVLAGLPLNKLRQIFITHHHSDHDIDLGALAGDAEHQQRDGIVDMHPGGTADIQKMLIARGLGLGKAAKAGAR